MNKDLSQYNLLTDITSGAGDFKMILDSANSKYNNTMWRSFTDVLPASRSKKFSTIVKETGIIVKASVLGSMSKKPLRSVEGGQSYTDNMPKIGQGFKVDQADMNYIEELNLVNTPMSDQMLEIYRNRAANIIGGFHASWNGWIFEALSDQEITLESLGGTKSVVDLRVPAKQKLKAKGDKGWFEANTTAKIFEDLIRMEKIADDDADMPKDRVFVCSKELWDKISMDEEILKRVRATMLNATEYTFINPKRVMELIPTVFGVSPIVAIDERSRHEVDGIAVDSDPSFNPNKIALVPARKLFDMHNSPSDYTKDTNPATIKSSTEGGLIGAIQIFGSEPINIVTNMESWSFSTFKNPKWIVALDSSKASATGL